MLSTLGDMSQRDQLLLVLRDIKGHTYEEIAEKTGLPLGTVKSGLSRARQRFADRFTSMG